MNGYALIEQRFIRYEQGLRVFIVTIQVDTANDLPTPQNNWAPGSICMIAATHTYKVLNEQGEWV